MAEHLIWFLNFDADDELANPEGYHPSPRVLARFPALEARVAALLSPGDRLMRAHDSHDVRDHDVRDHDVRDHDVRDHDVRDFEGRAWCPTPRAVRAWQAVGARVPNVPPVEVLRRVNSRAFCATMGPTLPGAAFVTRRDDVDRVIASPTPTGHWLLKRPFGFAGRGRRRVRRGDLDEAARAWVDASLAAEGGLQIEPWVEREGDYGLHGFVDRAGRVSLGAETVQRIGANGTWQATERAAPTSLASDERTALFDAATHAAQALTLARYFGPFGVDAFRWRDEHGAARFNPRCDVNARYSMGWAIGMGANRPDRAPAE